MLKVKTPDFKDETIPLEELILFIVNTYGMSPKAAQKFIKRERYGTERREVSPDGTVRVTMFD